MIEPEVDFEPSRPEPTTMFESATDFGLTPEEVWETVMATLDCLSSEARARYVDELTGALAGRLLQKERRL
jgi:hypothetical protein